MPNITKLQHEKLFAAIDRLTTERDDALAQNAIDERRVEEAETRTASDERALKNLREQISSMSEDRKELTARVAGRDEALVQLSLRIAEYGDPSNARLSLSPPVPSA